MVRTGWIVTVQVLVLSGSLLAAEAESGPDPKVVKNFRVRWSSVQYHKSVVVENPEVSKTSNPKPENLTLTCQVEPRDPNLVLGIGRQAVISRLIDSKGRDVAVGVPAPIPHDTYETFRYERRFRHPTPMPRWRAFIEKLLQRPLPPPGPPQLVTELRPSQINIGLDMGLLDQAGGELRSVQGYFRALVVGSTEYVDVPFEPNNAWVRLTPDMEIQVQEATRGNTSFNYRIKVRPQAGGRPLMVGQPVPERFVAAQLFIGEDGKLLDRMGGSPWLPAPVGGAGSHSGGTGRIKAIRYVIAVHAKECKIPFEFQHVPLPKP